jgi:thiol:disulfide interchange protein/DsbC/DsbD-like thiol-disulfide interchange protein
MRPTFLRDLWLRLARPLALGLALSFALALSVGAPCPVRAANPLLVTVDLIAESAGISPGGAVWVGIRQRIAPGWHTYWINPGDSGEALTIDWALPPGFIAEPIVWPHPERIPVGPAMSHGYTGETVLLVRVAAPAELAPGRDVVLRGRAAWLVCERTCIPEEADVVLTLPVVSGPAGPGAGAAEIARTRRAVPVASPWRASLAASPERVVLTVAAPGLAADRIADMWFYPTQWGLIEYAAPQEARVDARGLTLTMARGPLADAVERPVDGVLVLKERLEGDKDRRDGPIVSQAFAIHAGRPTTLASAARPALSVLTAVGLAFVGGLLLNLMPCVLPVLSIKALGLVQQADAAPRIMRRHGLAHTAGVLACFLALAVVLITLRAGGAGLGWGFQLQSPLVVAGLAYLFFILALALSGVLALGGRRGGLGASLAARPGYAGSFWAGALVAVAASPCTAPFMGAATGFALTQPAAIALAVFAALGLGLAAPYLALSAMPAWRRLLPRPGPWMRWLERALALPLYATAAWLTWVLRGQVGEPGAAAVVTGLILIALAAWALRIARGGAPARRRLAAAASLAGAVLAVALGALVLGTPAHTPDAAAADGMLRWEPWTARRVAEAQAAGRPVFVNFTAAWCITCLVNERVALRSPDVAAAFAGKQVVYLKADWTSRSAEIATALDGFGRSGVPLYVLYPPGGRAAVPIILPPILSERIVVDAVNGL